MKTTFEAHRATALFSLKFYLMNHEEYIVNRLEARIFPKHCSSNSMMFVP